MTIKTGCQCFTCRHRDEPRVVAGYCQGFIEASNWFINWCERHNMQEGHIDKDDLSGIYTQMLCNRTETASYAECLPDLETDTDCNRLEDKLHRLERNNLTEKEYHEYVNEMLKEESNG